MAKPPRTAQSERENVAVDPFRRSPYNASFQFAQNASNKREI
jgi:hypothetical protein